MNVGNHRKCIWRGRHSDEADFETIAHILPKINGVNQRDGGEMRIFTLNEHEFSIGKSPEYQMKLTAEPLE